MEVPLASSSSRVIDFPRRGIVGAGRTTAPARGTESPREREPIGMEQVIADMAALMGGTLKTIAETQRAMAARVEGTGEPHRRRERASPTGRGHQSTGETPGWTTLTG